DSSPCVPTGLLPLAVQVGPSGAYAWVANNGDDSQPGSVTAFTILPSGVLSQIAEVETGGTPQDIAFNSRGTYGVVLDHDGRLLLYQVAFNGAPSLQSSVQLSAQLSTVTFAASDQVVLVAQFDKDIVSAYAFHESTGQLEWLADSPVETGPIAMACRS